MEGPPETNLKLKRCHSESRLKQLFWLIGRRSKLRLRSKLLLYKAMIKPIWTYGIQIWSTASLSNRHIIQKFQNKVLRMVSNAHLLHDNSTIHKKLGIPWVKEEIARFSVRYKRRLHEHPNNLAINLLDNSSTIRRLKRTHPLDNRLITIP
ncbi:hypothetical protein KR018_007087, partial [Drosophila ironensis]